MPSVSDSYATHSAVVSRAAGRLRGVEDAQVEPARSTSDAALLLPSEM